MCDSSKGFVATLTALLHHGPGRVRDVADKPQSVTRADHLGAECAEPLVRDDAGLKIADVVWCVVHALFAFLASFDELLISLFLAGVRAQTLPVRIWNSLNLQVEPTIAAVSAFLISVTTLILAIEAVLRLRLGQRRGRA